MSEQLAREGRSVASQAKWALGREAQTPDNLLTSLFSLFIPIVLRQVASRRAGDRVD